VPGEECPQYKQDKKRISASVTATISVWDDDPATADDKLRLVEKSSSDGTWNFMKATEQLGRESWFALGDRDLANVCQAVSTLQWRPGLGLQ
jgi:type IV secretion system protein VirB4